MKKFFVALLLLAPLAQAEFPPLKSKEAKLSILTDEHGMTVYTFDKDTAGVSNCNGTCASAWPPVMAPQGNVSAPLSVVTRQDGSHQLAFKNHPLYFYAQDMDAEDLYGDGVGGIWHVVHP